MNKTYSRVCMIRDSFSNRSLKIRLWKEELPISTTEYENYEKIFYREKNFR